MKAGDYAHAKALLREALAAQTGKMEAGDPEVVRLLVLIAETDARSGQPDEALNELSRALAIAAPVGPVSQPTSQRGAHLHMATVFEGVEDVARAQAQLTTSLELCDGAEEIEDAAVCNVERYRLVALLETTGRRDEAETYAMAALAAVQQDWGAYDIRLAFALADTAAFYFRGGQYHLAEPLLARSRSLWKSVAADAYQTYQRAQTEQLRDPFGPSITRLAPGNAAFSIAPGGEIYNELLRKLGRREEADRDQESSEAAWKQATIAEERAWALVTRTEATSSPSPAAQGIQSVQDTREANRVIQAKADAASMSVERAADLHAAGWALYHLNHQRTALKVLEEAEGIYSRVWPGLDAAGRRRLGPPRIALLELLAELSRSAGKFDGAIALLSAARDIGRATLDLSDERRLDLFLLAARSQREAGNLAEAEKLVSMYLEAVTAERGDDHPDRAWGLRNLAWVLMAKGDNATAAKVEGEAQRIWERWTPEYPGF